MSYPIVHLGDAAETIMGQAPPGRTCNKVGEGTAFVKAGEFRTRRPVIREWTTQPLKLSREGDVLVCVVGATAGKVNEAVDCAIGRSVAAIRPKDGQLSTSYLYHYLSRQTMHLRERSQGLAQGVITRDMLSELELPLPPIEDQMHIAAILDQAHGIRINCELATKLANEFLRAAFLDLFGDPQTNPKKLPTAPVKHLGRVLTGNTPPRNTPDYYGQGIDWVKSDNLGALDHYVTPPAEQLSRSGRAVARLAPVGSTLITCIAGSPSSIGNAALTDHEVAFNQQINAVIPTANVDPAFLYCQFLVGKTLVQQASTNSMKGMVTKSKFEEILFLNPPTSEQRRFGCIFLRVVEHIRRLRHAADESKELFASLSQRAFAGEL
jgi:type I restriction enzyme S subunit